MPTRQQHAARSARTRTLRADDDAAWLARRSPDEDGVEAPASGEPKRGCLLAQAGGLPKGPAPG